MPRFARRSQRFDVAPHTRRHAIFPVFVAFIETTPRLSCTNAEAEPSLHALILLRILFGRGRRSP